jgi:DNA-binding MarR family transcriptional regulator
MNARTGDQRDDDAAAATAREVWQLMSDLVLDHQRRREVTETTGMSFGRTRAVRRVARQPLSMGELAAMLGIDPPNATVLVDELESQGLVRRRPHPTDRRAKLVEPTRKGKALARRADDILAKPPPGLVALSHEDLDGLRQILTRAAAPGERRRGG